MPSWPQFAVALACTVLVVHLAFILWVVFGAVFTRGRRWLTVVHAVCAVYGLVIEVVPWPCPLTLLENWFEVQAGRMPYNGPFLLHYLDATVYPNVPPMLLIAGAAIALAANATVYFRRWRKWRRSKRD
jgi:hypothetical protein